MNDKNRMTNVERSPKPETSNVSAIATFTLAIRFLTFEIHSSFVIRHSLLPS